MRIPGVDRRLISALVLGLMSGGLAAQTVPGAATRLLPGSMSTGRADSSKAVEQSVDLKAYDSRTTYVVELMLSSLSAVEAAAALGLADARRGLAEYSISRELLDGLLQAGFEPHLLAGVTTHRFSLDGAPDVPAAAPGTLETAQRSATILATPGSFYISSGVVNDPIPDNGWAWRWIQVGAGSEAPSGSVTTNLKYRLRIHNDSNPANFYCGDYEIYLSSEAQGGGSPTHLVYDNLGGATDGGFDDDAADDSDIYLNLRETAFFNGEDPNQQWYVYVIDNWSGDSGFLHYIEFDVYWEAPGTSPDLIATDITFRDQPEQGGVEVTDPLPGQELYPHFYFTVESESELTGKIYAIDLSGTPLCSYTGPLGAGNWVAWCTSPWTATAGDYDLRGLVDPDDTFAESNETNNAAVRHYTIGGSCSPDVYEPDDSSAQASTLTAGAPQTHSICPTGDEDWATFTLGASSGIVLETAGASGDTRMWLYDSGLSEIEYDDDDGSGTFSMIDRQCGVDELAAGTYYVQIDEYGDDDTIDDYTLSLTVTSCGGDPDIRVEPLTLEFDNTAPPLVRPTPATDPAVVAELSRTAQLQGKVRVIVGLDVGWVAESHLPDPLAVERQRGRIAAAQATVLHKLRSFDVGVLARYRFINFMALEVDAQALAALAALPEITSLEEDVAVPPAMASSNPIIGSPAAWAAGYEGQGQVVAVLDTGVDKTHPYFSTGGNKVVSEACYSTTSAPNDIYSVCPGGVSSSTDPGSGVNCSPTTITACHHGTHVAGSVAGNDGTGPNFGVAREAELIAVQVFSRFDDPADCGGSAPCVKSFTSDQISGLERVYELRTTFNIASANMSLGGGQYFSASACDAAKVSLKAAIDNLRAVGIATVASSGNDDFRDSMGSPGCISTAVSVGATTDADVIASFSNVASFLDLLAPGVSITSSAVGGGTLTWNGTSMATPHVAGAWAILKQASSAATVDDVLTALHSTGTSIDDTRGGGTVTDMRRINVDLALAAIQSGASEIFTIYNDGSGTLSVTSMDLDTSASWIGWAPPAPFDIAPGGSRQVTVMVDFDQAPSGLSTRRLLIGSNDPDENPYPGGVFINVNTTPSACYPLTLGHTGSGADPTPTPANSPGCAAGEYHTGELVTLTALPDPGWAVGSWAGTNNDSSTATVNFVTMPAAAHAAEVHYIVAPCLELSLSHTGMGADPTPSPTSSAGCALGEYNPGESVTLTAAPDPGWVVDGWSGTDDDASTSTVNSLTMPGGNHAAAVHYAEPPTGYVKKIIASDPATGAGFGGPLALGGDTAILGASGNGSIGAAYVFERNLGGPGNWGEVKKLVPSAGASGDRFGTAVAISGDTVVVGADRGNEIGDPGAVYIYERDQGGAGSWGETKRLQAPTPSHDAFGCAVAIDGDTLVVGGFKAGTGNPGLAWVFERDQGGAGNWGFVKELAPTPGVTGAYFGDALAIDGDYVLVGAWHEDYSIREAVGSAYLFERHYGGTNNWGGLGKFMKPGTLYDYDYFGSALAIHGDTVAIGAYLDDHNGFNSGSVSIFRRDLGGPGVWGLARKLLGDDMGTSSNAMFGASVALDGTILVAGAPDQMKATPGLAQLFVRDQGGTENWGEVDRLLAPDGVAGDYFGSGAAISGPTIFVGASLDDHSSTDGAGSAYVFEVASTMGCYALTTSHTGSGADPVASPSQSVGCPLGEYLPAEPISLTAAPDTGWVVDSWTGTDDDASTSTVNTLTMPAANHAAAVHYSEFVGPPNHLVMDYRVMSGSEVYEACLSITLGPELDIAAGANFVFRSPEIKAIPRVAVSAGAQVAFDNSKPAGCP